MKSTLISAFMVALLFASPWVRAEDKNPFTGKQSMEDAGKADEEDFMGDTDNFGFAPPKPISPPTDTRDPNPPSVTPPTVNTQPQNEPQRSARPTPPRPPSVPAARAKKTTKKTESTTERLAKYLELDPSVRSLEVKNFDIIDRNIKDVVTLISKWTGKNFILDSKVASSNQKITILGPSQVTLQEAYQAFLSALASNNLTTVENGKFIRVIQSSEARRSPVKTYAGSYAPNTDQFITRIFQLKYINADEVQKEFRDMVTRQGKLFAYEPTNSIIITDTGSNIERIINILRTLDVKSFETSLQVLPMKYGSAKSIAEMLDKIYAAPTGKGGAAARRRLGSNALERTRGGGIIAKIIPDEQTNSLVVLANNSGFAQLRRLVAKLDVSISDTGKIHVYYCQYAKAEDLAQTLAALSGGGSKPAASSRRTGSRRSSRTGTSRSSSRSSVTAELEGGVKVTADAATNALVITASSTDYNTLKRVIRKLDIPRLQVFIESAIMEIALGDNTNIGINLGFSSNDKLFGGGFIGDQTSITNALAAIPPDGFTLPFRGNTQTLNKYGIKGFAGLLNFLTAHTQSTILSTPQIIALDNEKAEFKVQDSIPVASSFSQGSSANTLPTVNTTREKIGIDMKITPHVNAASRTIRLEIEQKIDTIKPDTSVPSALRASQVATTTRETNTSTIVKDKDYIMLGGLMRETTRETETKVPLLGDIPILGWLFKATTSKPEKTNLVILMQPRIISTTADSARLIQDKMRKRREFIEEHIGEDPHEEGISEVEARISAQAQRAGLKAATPPPSGTVTDALDEAEEAEEDELFEEEPKAEDAAPKDEGAVLLEGADPDAPLLSEDLSSEDAWLNEFESDEGADLLPSTEESSESP